MLIRDGRILAVGQGRRVENLADARDAVEIDATRQVVLPGFVDSHTHLVSGQPRLAEFEMLSPTGTGTKSLPRRRAPVRHPEVRATPSRTLHRKPARWSRPVSATAPPRSRPSPAMAWIGRAR